MFCLFGHRFLTTILNCILGCQVWSVSHSMWERCVFQKASLRNWNFTGLYGILDAHPLQISSKASSLWSLSLISSPVESHFASSLFFSRNEQWMNCVSRWSSTQLHVDIKVDSCPWPHPKSGPHLIKTLPSSSTESSRLRLSKSWRLIETCLTLWPGLFERKNSKDLAGIPIKINASTKFGYQTCGSNSSIFKSPVFQSGTIVQSYKWISLFLQRLLAILQCFLHVLQCIYDGKC